MATNELGGRVGRWLRPSRKPVPVARPLPQWQVAVQHMNPFGYLDELKRRHPHSMPVGLDREHNFIYTKAETTLVACGPARALGGKSASISTPVLIQHNGPAVVMSLRSDALRSSVLMRSRLGKAYQFNPDGLSVPPGVVEYHWSLVVGAEDLSLSIVTCRAFLKSAIVIDADSDQASDAMHFTVQGGTILGVLCHYAALTGKDFRWVYQFVITGNMDAYTEVITAMSFWEDQRPHNTLRGVLSMPGDRELGSILTTLNVSMGAYSTEKALASTDAPNLDFTRFVRADAKAENAWFWSYDQNKAGKGSGDTLYLIAGDKPISAAINVAIVTQIIEARHKLYNQDEEAGNADAHPDVLFCLDEMANMPLPQLPGLLAAPGKGCLFTGMLQDFSQLSKWGSEGPSMMTQMQQLVLYRGLRFSDASRMVESICPTIAVERVLGSSKNDGGGLTASASPERLPSLPTYRIYSGIDRDPATVLYLGADGLQPDWIHIQPYYSDPVLLHAQVMAIWWMSQYLDLNDPRRQLPPPNLNRDGTGSALKAAGGHTLYDLYVKACFDLKLPQNNSDRKAA